MDQYLINKYGPDVILDEKRVFVPMYKKQGTVLSSGEHKNQPAYAVLLDGDLDCFVLYAEEFQVLEV